MIKLFGDVSVMTSKNTEEVAGGTAGKELGIELVCIRGKTDLTSTVLRKSSLLVPCQPSGARNLIRTHQRKNRFDIRCA